MADPVDIVRDASSIPQPPIDPSAQIPESVRRAAALAESFYGKVEPAPDAPTKDAPPPVQTHDAPPLASDAPAEAPNYEHMYKSMKGRFDQSHTQAQQLAAELQAQQQFTQRLQQEVQNLKTPKTPERLISDEERHDYGDDFFDVVARRVQEVVGDKLKDVDALKAENEQLKAQQAQIQNNNLTQAVTNLVPNWREINTDPNFSTWLSLRDIYSGMTRLQLLQNAQRRSDAPSIAAFYNDYLADNGQPARPQSDVPPPAAPRVPAVTLESLVAPGRARPASDQPDVPVAKNQYTRKQISELYAQKRQGLWNQRIQDWNALEQDFIRAGSEGRVVG